MTFREAFSIVRNKIAELINSVRAGEFTQLLNYVLFSCVFIFGYTSLGYLLRVFGKIDLNAGIFNALDSIHSGANDAFEMSVFFVVLMLIVLIAWFYQLNKKLRQNGVEFNYSLSSVIWSWLIPGYNLFQPLKIMNETKKKAIEFSLIQTNDVSKLDKYWYLFLSGYAAMFFVEEFFRNKTEYFLLSVLALLMCVVCVKFRDSLGVAQKQPA
jgi:Domain of unknown function (DUF4328)